MTFPIRNMSTGIIETGANLYYSAVFIAAHHAMRGGVCYTIEFSQSEEVLSRHHPSGEVVAFGPVDKDLAELYLSTDVKKLAELLKIVPGVAS